MEKTDRKKHWQHIYETKGPQEVSWYQSKPEISLELVGKFAPSKSTKIIDIGGGDSLLVDYLLKEGYRDISVLDISDLAIHKAEKRLMDKAGLIKWIVNDVTEFNSSERYDLWHDRATFHFLTQKDEISKYLEIAYRSLNDNGILIIGTFSEQGPKKCSGIDVHQYSEESLTVLLKNKFRKIVCRKVDHKTPSGAIQNFLFCSFKKIS